MTIREETAGAPSLALRGVVERWLAHDPDPETQREARRLLRAADAGVREAQGALEERFSKRLAFGTAGLRGLLGAGPGRMNEALIRQVTGGLVSYLKAQRGEELERAPGSVVIGYDGRRGSRRFAEITARCVAGAGLRAWLWPTVCPTPLLAYSLRALQCDAGVMVTASHNPPEYNGFKVYWSDGAQITPPHDRGISAAIDAAPPADEIPCPPLDAPSAQALIAEVSEEIGERYLQAIEAQRRYRAHTGGLKIVYSAMHGVGARWVREALERAGYGAGLALVAEQAEPDGAFPTVAFPNPEEPGALDLSLALAEERGADLLLANDPDADRLAVAARDRAGVMRPLNGDQIGALIGDEFLSQGALELSPAPLVACSIVSSTLLPRMAEAAGIESKQTLTGFKWIARAGIEHEAAGGRFLFGYEEAIGFSIGPVVWDKDGVSAALFLCDMAARAKAEGLSLWDRLEAIYARFGVTLSALESWTKKGLTGAEEIRQLMATLRANPPAALAGVPIERVEDLAEAEGVMRGDVLIFHLSEGGRIIARPSGTEPKIKFYFEATARPRDGETENAPARARASAQLERWISDWRERYRGA